MSYYHRCPYCGATLDPSERCNCGGPVFRRIRDSVSEEVNKEIFLDLLRKIKEE